MNEDRYYQAAMFESKFIEGMPVMHGIDSDKSDELDAILWDIRRIMWSRLQEGLLAKDFLRCRCGEAPYVSSSKKDANDNIVWRASCSTCYKGVRAFSHKDLKTLWNSMMKEEGEETKNKPEEERWRPYTC